MRPPRQGGMACVTRIWQQIGSPSVSANVTSSWSPWEARRSVLSPIPFVVSSVMEQDATSDPRRTVPSRAILILKRARLNGVTENSFVVVHLSGEHAIQYSVGVKGYELE